MGEPIRTGSRSGRTRRRNQRQCGGRGGGGHPGSRRRRLRHPLRRLTASLSAHWTCAQSCRADERPSRSGRWTLRLSGRHQPHHAAHTLITTDWPGHAGEREGSRTRSRARSRPATASGCGRSATPARAGRGRCLSLATSACSGRCIPGGRSCGGCPTRPGWWSASRSVTCPLPGTGARGKLRGNRKGTRPAAALHPQSPRRRPGNRVRAGRLQARRSSLDVGTSGPDPGLAAGRLSYQADCKL